MRLKSCKIVQGNFLKIDNTMNELELKELNNLFETFI
jgi:hypothetical protein